MKKWIITFLVAFLKAWTTTNSACLLLYLEFSFIFVKHIGYVRNASLKESVHPTNVYILVWAHVAFPKVSGILAD